MSSILAQYMQPNIKLRDTPIDRGSFSIPEMRYENHRPHNINKNTF